MQGRISCCNVLSDLFAMGITDIDNILMVLGVSTKMNELEKEVVTSQLIEGFDATAKEAGSIVTGGQTVFNPWPMIGGVGVAAVAQDEFLMPTRA
jgi:selenide,water dikinase